MIKLRNLNKFFFKGKKNQIHVLNNVSLELEEKGLVAIHGSSGSGKTTLLNVIGGLDKVNSGEIEFYDEYIPRYRSRVWDKIRNEYVGYIFQNYYLLPELSVYENIRFVLRNLGINNEEEIEHRVHYVLKAVGMYPFRKKKALQLSGGQQQRVAIARALVKNPRVIIADEPTGNLDSRNTFEIMNIIKEISKETLVILVTHEKEIANVYADRIITVEDGKIIADKLNDEAKDHNFADATIYLKDIKNQDNLKNEKVNVDVYYDKKLSNVNVKLILKDETLYVDVSGYKNIKLAESAGIVIKDEHYVKKSKEEVQKTTYDVKELDHKFVKKEKGLLFSVKKMFKNAFLKLLGTSRKGKLLFASFFIAGMIIAYAVMSFAAVAIIDADSYARLPKGYVEYSTLLDEEKPTLAQLEALKGDSEDFFINPYGSGVSLTFLKNDGTKGIETHKMFTHIDHAKKYKLVHGRHATAKNELVVSKVFLDSFLGNIEAQDFGVWNVNGLFNERIEYTNTDAKIVGVVDAKVDLIFASEEFMMVNALGNDILGNDITYWPVEAFENLNLVKGSMPVNKKDVLLNAAQLNNLGYPNIDEITFPLSILLVNPATDEQETYYVTGVHDIEMDYVLVKLDTLKSSILTKTTRNYIYSSNPKLLIQNLKYNLGIEGTDMYKQAIAELKDTRSAMIASAAVTLLMFVGATLVGFYFVMKSSLIQKIYEVAVYRALGVKKREIASSYLIEIIIITTITAFIGYTLMCYILHLLNQSFLGELMMFKINPLTYLIGLVVVYGLNIFAGLLPVFRLLMKTPARILSQYDI